MSKDTTITLAKPPKTLKLDLACGQTPREGFEGVDVWEGAKHRQDLLKFPWPWEDASVDELHCSHFIEHIPMATDSAGKDLLFAFFDECWRILKPGGKLTVLCPNARSNRAFQDPTHRRFIVAETFLYLHKPWRVANKLDHYNVTCDFHVQCDPIATISRVNASMTAMTYTRTSPQNAVIVVASISQMWSGRFGRMPACFPTFASTIAAAGLLGAF